VNAFDPLKHADRSERSQPKSSTASNGVEFAAFHIPWTKVTLRAGADISVTARPDDPSCPLAALRHHMNCNTDAKIPSSAPMFSFETADGGWSPMTKTWFMSRCNEVWVAAGLPDMPGHGFRIGGATHLLLMGTPRSSRHRCSARSLEISGLFGILEEDQINSPSFHIFPWEL